MRPSGFVFIYFHHPSCPCLILLDMTPFLYEEELVNGPQMDLKRKTSNLKKNVYFVTYPPPALMRLSHRFTIASKPVTLKYFCLLCQPLPHLRFIMCDFRTSLREFPDPVVNPFTLQTLPTVNMKHFFIRILCIESFIPQMRTTERCSSVVHNHYRHFDYRNQPLNMRMRVST
jgi:hypothetical protein